MDSLRQGALDSNSKGKRCVLVGGQRSRSMKIQRMLESWMPPAPGAFKINVDGAYISNSGMAALGVIIRDHNGLVQLAVWRVLTNCRDAEEAEAAACREGIVFAARWPNVPMVLETDCAVLADKLKKTGMQDRSVAWVLVRDAWADKEELCSLEVIKISRYKNNVAHELAHYAIRTGLSQVFFSSFPEFFLTLACKDIT